MKPHLPLALLAALVLVVPARGIEIPAEYEPIDIWTPSYLNKYTDNSSTDYYGFTLGTDVSFTPATNTSWTTSTPLVSGGNLIFTSSEDEGPQSLKFSSGGSPVFKQPTSLIFDTLSTLELSGNSGTGEDGAAIYMKTGGKLQISNVGTEYIAGTYAVLFSNNNVSGARYQMGGAIYSGSPINVSNNGDVAFLSNKCTTAVSVGTAKGGAIYSGSILLESNKTVTFQGNQAHKSYYYTGDRSNDYCASGGALYGSDVEISRNTDVVFSGNSALDNGFFAYGGAIYSTGKLSLSGNGSLAFSQNKATSSHGHYFSGFSAYYGHAYGGALYCEGGVAITGTIDSVRFAGNSVASSYYAYGGAIYAEGGAVELRNNGSVEFSGNKAVVSDSVKECLGGAIYSTAGISITGNGSVLFEKNYENGRLRSIYNTGGTFELSAKTGGSIIFNDSVYHSGTTVSFNADYEDATGVTQKATGDIIFSGKYTEEHLEKMKGSAGTSSEISASRTSYIGSLITLYGGSLQVVDGAVLSGNGLTVTEGSQATLLLRNGRVSGGAFTFNATSELKLEGANTITASSLSIDSGAAFTVLVGVENLTSAALSLGSTELSYSKLNFNLERTDGLTSGKFKIISKSSTNGSPASWTEETVILNSSGYANRAIFSDLVWENGTLYYQVGRTIWSNDSGDRLWNTRSDNWTMNDRSYTYLDGMDVSFTDTGAGEVKLVGDVAPASIIVNNSEGNNYSFVAADGGGRLTGSTVITKEGTGELSITTAIVHTGATVLNGGTLRVQHSTALGATAEGGTATVSTATGTTLSVENNSHLVLAGVNDIKGAVEVAEGATLEMQNAGYAASDTTVAGELRFRGSESSTASAGTLSGTGTVSVQDSSVTFSSQSGFTGNLNIEGAGASMQISSGAYNAAGSVTVSGSGAKLTFGSDSTRNNVTIKSGGLMELSSTGESAATVDLNQLTIAKGAVLSAQNTMVELPGTAVTLGDSLSRNTVQVGAVNAEFITLNSGSTYQALGGNLGLNGGELTLAISTTAAQKITLILLGLGDYAADTQVTLFTGVNRVNFIYDGIDATSNQTLKASDYFTGNWIGEDTKLVYDSAARTVYVENVVNYTVPEPATVTLSLLGLAVLLGRRRRKH